MDNTINFTQDELSNISMALLSYLGTLCLEEYKYEEKLRNDEPIRITRVMTGGEFELSGRERLAYIKDKVQTAKESQVEIKALLDKVLKEEERRILE